MNKIFSVFLILAFGTLFNLNAQDRSSPYVVFDGMYVQGLNAPFTWGQSTLDVEMGTGETAGTNSLKWVQGDEWSNGWSGAGYNICSPVDLSSAWPTDSVKLKIKAPVDMAAMRLQFESGADGLMGYVFTPTADDAWHSYSFALNDFVPQDGTTNFNPAAVNVFQVMAEGTASAGRVVYFDDVWVGDAVISYTPMPITVDGDLSDPLYTTLASWDGADNWGSSNELGDIKFYSSDDVLYIGITGVIEPNWNKLILFVDFDGANGIPAGAPLPGGGVPGVFQDGGIGGTVLNMETDFAFSWTTDPNNPLWCDAARYDASSVVAANGIGNSNHSGNPATLVSCSVMDILGGTTGFGLQAYQNTFDRTSNPDVGLELCLDVTAFDGVTNTQSVRFFVAIINNNGDYWSNEFLPDYYNTTGGSTGPFGADFGNDPDLNAAAIGATVDLYTTFSSIPVELTSFTASVTDGNVLLNWSTATETNNSGFEIERALGNSISDLQIWEKVGFVEGSGNSATIKSYSFTDGNVAAGNYSYRLKQIDYNGEYEYSDAVEVEVIAPIKFSLNQNYPNPFNPATSISYSIPEAQFVTLSVFNVLGQQVKTLVNENKEAGSYNINFDASGLNSGVYFYRLDAGSFSQVRKMMLTK